MDAEAPCRFALAQPLDLAGVANPSVQLHREHPPPSSSFRPSSRKASGRYSLAPPRPGHSAGRLRGTLSHCRLQCRPGQRQSSAGSGCAYPQGTLPTTVTVNEPGYGTTMVNATWSLKRKSLNDGEPENRFCWNV